MVLCPVALAVGCRKCPVFSVCPLKSTIGDYQPAAAAQAQTETAARPRKPKAAAAKPDAAKPAGEPRRRSARRR